MRELTIRTLFASEYQQAIDLADRTFRSKEQKSMGDAFPHVFSRPLGQGIGAFDQERLVSYMGLVPAFIDVNVTQISSYLLGSVCTDIDYRGRGLASKLLSEVFHHVEEASASLLFVSGDRPLYQRAHCSAFGSFQECTFVRSGTEIEEASRHQDLSWEIRDLNSTDWLTILKIRKKLASTISTTPYEWATLLESEAFSSCFHAYTRILVAKHNDVVSGYAVVSIPLGHEHLSGTILEWYGDQTCLQHMIIAAIRRWGLEKLVVYLDESDLFSLDTAFTTMERRPVKNQGTVAIINAEQLYEEILPDVISRGYQDDDQLQFHPLNKNTWEIVINNRSWVMSHEELVAFLFDNQFEKEDWGKEEELLRRAWFPIKLPYLISLHYV